MTEGAFVRAMERELRACLVDSWCEFIRWMRDDRLSRDDVLEEATGYAAAGYLPPWPDLD